jgi:hypothetical protein
VILQSSDHGPLGSRIHRVLLMRWRCSVQMEAFLGIAVKSALNQFAGRCDKTHITAIPQMIIGVFPFVSPRRYMRRDRRLNVVTPGSDFGYYDSFQAPPAAVQAPVTQ